MRVRKLEPGEQPMTAGAGGKLSMDDNIKKTLIIVIVSAVLVGGAGFMWLGGNRNAQAQEATPTLKPPIVIQTVPPLEAAQEPTPTTALEPAQIAATATFQAAINRPAVEPGNSQPFFVGVITYESGCPITNLGFTTAGYSGEPFYLYLPQMLDRDPLFQVVQIKGVVQQFDDCPLPVLFATEIFWLAQQATPAPINVMTTTTTLTGTATITPTAFNPATWGMKPGTETPAAAAGLSLGGAALPTYTPYPTPTSPPPPAPTRYPTYTPYPRPEAATATPAPTLTPTPQTASVYGKIAAVGGCAVSNFAVTAADTNYFIIFGGAQLPPSDPTRYSALVVGALEPACSGQAIRATQILWYEPTPTPTLTPTATIPATVEPTATLTPTATTPPTSEPTATATTPPTVEPTTEAAP